uniref:Uncharacterized protein n=1 Tax=Rhizophagus irregularis (strain DAOM 181602 / DAOM 197198 / MUCL 43194) TaxID=747089 RepID=U9TMB8_RHIID
MFWRGLLEVTAFRIMMTSFFGERYVLAFYPWVTDSIMNCFINVSIFFIDPGILNFEPGSWVSESKFLCKFTFGERVLDTDHVAYRSGLTISLVLFQKMKISIPIRCKN